MPVVHENHWYFRCRFGVIKVLLEILEDLAAAHEIPFLGMVADHNPEKNFDGKWIRAFWYDINLHHILTCA